MDRVLTLHFIDGSKLSFEFDEQTGNQAARTIKLADFMALRPRRAHTARALSRFV